MEKGEQTFIAYTIKLSKVYESQPPSRSDDDFSRFLVILHDPEVTTSLSHPREVEQLQTCAVSRG